MGWIRNKIDDYFASKMEELRSEDSSQTNLSDSLLSAIISGSGISVKQAESIPAVASCLDKISCTIAMLPIKLYKTEMNEGKSETKEINDDYRVFLLNKSTGDTINPFNLKKNLVSDYFLYGRGYIYKETSGNSVISLRYVSPVDVQPLKDTHPIFKTTMLNVQGMNYENCNFISVLRNTKDGALGQSIVEEISKALESAYQTMIFELSLAKKGGNKKGFLQAKHKLSDEAFNKLKDSWKKLYSNNNDAEENAIILNDGIEFKESSATSVELQLDERKNTLKEEIRSIFHDSDDYDTFVKNAVMPVISMLEYSLNENLLLEDEKSSFYFKFETKELTRGNLKDRYEAYKTAKETGWMTLNEIRESEDKNKIDGLDVIPMSLADVVYDTNTKTYYTPNTNATKQLGDGGVNDENRSKE